VIDLNPEQLEPAPTLGTRINAEFIQNMGKVEEGFVIILDMNRVFTSDQLADVDHANLDKDNVKDVA